MTWLALLVRFWKPLAGAALLIGAALWLRHSGYESGYAASEAKWQPAFAAAERARDAANLVALQKEADSNALSRKAEAEHEKSVASLNLRAADADKRIRALSMRLAAASAGRSQVCPASGGAVVPDAAAEVDQRASEAGGSVATTGAGCEADAATIDLWQSYYTEQRAIINRAH